jgi:hypothetical protein
MSDAREVPMMEQSQTSTSNAWWLAAIFVLVVGTVPATVAAQQVDTPGDDLDTTPGASDSEDDAKASAESRLTFALSAYHAFPTRAELDDIADAKTITRLLRQFATAGDTRPSMKTRALDAMGYYDDATTRAFLVEVIEQPESVGTSARVADLMRHHAITSLARAHGDGALGTLTPLLDHDDLQIRLTTVVSLGKHGGEQAHRRLAKLRRDADNRMIIRQIDKYVGRQDVQPSP